ncbi:hypothetical protein FLL45_15205 [Aliikangiella marina]|uniref:Uncharacterized protein n=1 Tax=Aliikangiella marina TaxID=1712262 RepID=A0A545T6K2_9GAMM|nr:hypothetical protein [Aliikangiella marina]TQV72815.1 hypothetical protein FLL45_15205 [Aliikangiella marina]
MNIRFNYRKNRTLGIILTFFVVFSGRAFAEDIAISMTESQCTVSMSSADNGCDAGQCAGDSACVCAAKGDFITWILPGNDKFKLKFSGDSPLKDNCGKNYKASKQKCKIKEDVSPGQEYTYLVKLKKCANGTDPRVVIKGGRS